MVSRWPTHAWYPSHDRTPSEAARMLTLLPRLEDLPRIDMLLAKIAARGGYDKQDNDAISGALAIFSLEKRVAMIDRLIAATAEMSLGACGELLARAVVAPALGRKPDFGAAARRLVEALPGDPARPHLRTHGGGVPVWNPASLSIC